ncbi:MAG: hypothetical protein JWR15_4208, partial [Prosthecobacter sp.]|nr:hypothetical protein [Prosthecobacter sp.]
MESPPATSPTYDFFISYTAKDEAWAEWIAHHLREHGYSFRFQKWHFNAGNSWVVEMQKALQQCQRMIAVLSPAYLASEHGQAEWNVFYAKDPSGSKALLIPVRIAKTELNDLHLTRNYIDFVGKVEGECLAALLQGIKPTEPTKKPVFPSSAASNDSGAPVPFFPGLPRNNLPTIQRFFGRDTELAKLLPDLHPDATGWGALIDGPGGIGKTTLAIRAAELAAPGHFDDIIFLSAKLTGMDPHGPHDESLFAMCGLTQMLDVIARHLQKLEITKAPAYERPRLLIDALACTRTLLVLDNLETLTEADNRGLFAFLSRLPRTCKAILTSRPLSIATGRRLMLQQLDQDAALQTLADIAQDNPALDATFEIDRLRLITETGGNTLLLIWTAWQVGSGYCTTIADALNHLRSCPLGNDPLQFIFGDLLARFTPEEERIVATLSYPTEPIPVSAIVEISGVDESITRRALKLLTNRSIVVPQDSEETYALVPMVAEFIRHARREVVGQMGEQLADRAFRLINENGRKHFARFAILESIWPTISPALPIFLAGDNTRLQLVCDSLQKFFDFQGRWDEWLLLSQQAEAKAVQAGDFAKAGWRAHNIAACFSLRHRGDDVLAWAERAAMHWQLTDAAVREKAASIRLRGLGHKLNGNYSAALIAFREALGLFRS